jgi:phosphate-selective porin OprO/OprP
VGDARVGYFKEPFGLEEITSSNDITFMERSLTDAFVERRNLGIMFERRFTAKRRMTAALGLYRDANNNLEVGDGYGVTGRVTGAPILSEDDRRVLHVGGSVTYRVPGDDGLQFSSRPESAQAQVMADTGALAADRDFRVGLELGGVRDSLSLQTETMFASSDGPAGSQSFWSTYLMGSYVLTGENRSYRERVGAFGTVLPDRALGKGGRGAWELAGRYSYLDLNSGAVSGGALHDWTLGLNWYANLNMRVMFNYVAAHPEGFGVEHILQTRLQLTF